MFPPCWQKTQKSAAVFACLLQISPLLLIVNKHMVNLQFGVNHFSLEILSGYMQINMSQKTVAERGMNQRNDILWYNEESFPCP